MIPKTEVLGRSTSNPALARPVGVPPDLTAYPMISSATPAEIERVTARTNITPIRPCSVPLA